jgi:tyrosinase
MLLYQAVLAVVTLGAFTSAQTQKAASKPAATTSTACKTRVVRKEIRDLSTAERNLFFKTLKKATTGNPSILNRLSATHLKNNDFIHAGPNFLPWHRLFIRRLEGELQKIEPKFALHYWDWTKDARAPEQSVILKNNYYGGNSNGRCLKTTTFGQVYAGVPTRHCLTRQYASGASPGAFYPRAITDAIINQYSTFQDFAMALEGGPHAAPHNGLGGDIGTMQSPEDPIFFAHHSFIDYQYAQWQDMNASRKKSYGGTNQNGSRAKLTDQLVSLKARVSDVLDYKKLCYTYASTSDPDDYGTENDAEWAGSSTKNNNQQQQQQQQQPQQAAGGWVWDDNSQQWVQAGQQQQQQAPQAAGGWVWDDSTQQWQWAGLVRRNYAATRPAAAAKTTQPTYAPAAAAAPRRNYTAPAANDYAGVKPKMAPLRMLTEEELECAAKKYTAPLVHPRPIDEKWLKMMGLCVVTQRALEKSYCDVIDKVNTKIQERCDAY